MSPDIKTASRKFFEQTIGKPCRAIANAFCPEYELGERDAQILSQRAGQNFHGHDSECEYDVRKGADGRLTISVTPKDFYILGMTVFSFSSERRLAAVEVYGSEIHPRSITAQGGSRNDWKWAREKAGTVVRTVVGDTLETGIGATADNTDRAAERSGMKIED